MSLRRQLLLVSLLLLALPWAGCQYVREMENALQSGQEQALLATSRAVATVVAQESSALTAAGEGNSDRDPARQLYATLAEGPVIVDGYGDGWVNPVHGQYGPVSYRAQVREDKLYLLFSIKDERVVYHNPRSQQPSGDFLRLQTARADYVILTAAPGAVQGRIERGRNSMGFEPRIRGFWQDSLDGFTVELEMPLSLIDQRLAFEFVPSEGTDITLGNRNLRLPPPILIYPNRELQTELVPFARDGIVLRIADPARWQIAEAGDDGKPASYSAGDTPWLLKALYRAVLNGPPADAVPTSTRVGELGYPELERALAGEPAAAWYAAPEGGGRKLLVTATPVRKGDGVVGAVLATQGSEPYLSLTDQAFSRLLYWSLLALLISALGLLGYASWLSWRIRRLSRASANVIRSDGSLDADFPVSHTADEIGELSRQYADLLARLRDYTDYLRTLSRKLSHELRTPIAVIQSSLDNLEAQEEDSEIYVIRAREGLSRLSNILTAMSEATRLEESVHSNQPEHYDLAALYRNLFEAYQGLYAEQTLELHMEMEALPVYGVPDLVAQMLDKLMDNAASFTPAGGRISLGLSQNGTSATLTVANEGPLLPDAMQRQLFDSMVSVRDKSSRVHLGLGLHIVRLIVEFHGGRVSAGNLPDESGVEFRVQLPLDASL